VREPFLAFGAGKWVRDVEGLSPLRSACLPCINEEYIEHPLNFTKSGQEPKIRQQMQKSIPEFIEKKAPIYALGANLALSQTLQRSKELMKESHNKALYSWLEDPGIGLSRDLQLRWRVQMLEGNSLILGDPVVLYRRADDSHLSAGLGKRDLVLVPLAHNLLLIGAVDKAVELPSLDEINRSSAELSLNFFISHCRGQKEEEYHKLIGKRAPTVEKE
jgi:hypothetical protein